MPAVASEAEIEASGHWAPDAAVQEDDIFRKLHDMAAPELGACVALGVVRTETGAGPVPVAEATVATSSGEITDSAIKVGDSVLTTGASQIHGNAAIPAPSHSPWFQGQAVHGQADCSAAALQASAPVHTQVEASSKQGDLLALNGADPSGIQLRWRAAHAVASGCGSTDVLAARPRTAVMGNLSDGSEGDFSEVAVGYFGEGSDAALPPSPMADTGGAARASAALPETTQAGTAQSRTGHISHPLIADTVRQLAEALPPQPQPGDIAEISVAGGELGLLRIRLLHDAGTVTMTIHAERFETLDLFRRNIDELARDLRDLGFAASSFSFQQDQQASSRDAQLSPVVGQSDTGPEPGLRQQDWAAAPLATADDRRETAGLDLRL